MKLFCLIYYMARFFQETFKYIRMEKNSLKGLCAQTILVINYIWVSIYQFVSDVLDFGYMSVNPSGLCAVIFIQKVSF